MTAQQETFEGLILEFKERSRAILGEEVTESLPPGLPSPYVQSGPPYECALRLDSRTIRNYAIAYGDDNPLFTDPEYGRRTRYGCQLAPNPILSTARGITAHGVQGGEHARQRPQGYPVANFHAGNAWEFFDVIRVGSKFSSSMTTQEMLEKKGSRGDLIILVSELMYWDQHGDLPAKCYGTLIMFPIPSMGTSRSMNVDRLGENLIYERTTQQYNEEQLEEIIEDIDNHKRRGAETLYWEDVNVGDKVGPLVIAPWTLQDYAAHRVVDVCSHGNPQSPGDELAFEVKFRQLRQMRGGAGGGQAVGHPVTRWPWGPADEHEDALTAAYRGLPGPFDGGGQRAQIFQRLLTDWMGDDGFIRREQVAMRKPVFYGDTIYVTGTVEKKYKEVQEGDDKPGGVPGKAEYHAVGIRLQGVNQVGETATPGTACVYLPSRENGPIPLPVPHPARPPFVPYETFYRDWF
jgi:acyl dehydratase